MKGKEREGRERKRKGGEGGDAPPTAIPGSAPGWDSYCSHRVTKSCAMHIYVCRR